MSSDKRPMNPRIPFYASFLIFGTAAYLFERFHLHSPGQILSVIQGPPSDMTTAQHQQLEAFLGMNSLVTTLGTGLLGALFFLMGQSRTPYSAKQLVPALLSALCVALSLYFGYKAYEDLVVLLGTYPFTISNTALDWDRRAHFYTFVLGVILFADFTFYELTRGRAERKTMAAHG